MSCNPSQTDDDPCMLDRIVRIIQLGSCDPHVLPLTVAQHFFYPAFRYDFYIIIQKQKVLSLCIGYCEIIDCRIIELSFPGNDPDILLQVLDHLIISKGVFFLTVIFYHKDFIIIIRSPFPDGFQTFIQIFHMILIRNNNGYLWMSRHFVDRPVSAEQRRKFHLGLYVKSGIMSFQSLLSRLKSIHFAFWFPSCGIRVGTPVI